MVSLIQSNYPGFGSGVTVERLGFGLQNRGSLFALTPGTRTSTSRASGRSTRSSPRFVDAATAQPLLAFGVMGGAMQPQGHVQVLTNLIDFGMNLQGRATRRACATKARPSRPARR